MSIRRAGRPPEISISGLVGRPRLLDEPTIRGRGVTDDSAPEGVLVVELRDLLAGSEVSERATYLSVVSDDGLYTASIPLVEALAKGRLFVGGSATMDRSVGGPFRLAVPDGRTLCWNVKSVGELRVTHGPERDSVPDNPTH